MDCARCKSNARSAQNQAVALCELRMSARRPNPGAVQEDDTVTALVAVLVLEKPATPEKRWATPSARDGTAFALTIPRGIQNMLKIQQYFMLIACALTALLGSVG